MHTHSFSDAQAAHALEVVLTLMKKRRFFLYRQEEYGNRIERDLGHRLDPAIFAPAIKLDEDIRTVYAEATHKAKQAITEAEQKMGIVEPDLSGHRRLVQCNRYTGGLDICRVYPLTAFTELAPDPLDLKKLEEQETGRLMGNKSPDDYSAKEMLMMKDTARKNALIVWREIGAMKAVGSGSACVVLLKTRFEPTGGDKEDDFLEGRLANIKLFPHGMGYLFYEYSKRNRIVRHSHVVFNTSRQAHVSVQHWNNGELLLRFDSHSGYSCEVYLPIVL